MLVDLMRSDPAQLNQDAEIDTGRAEGLTVERVSQIEARSPRRWGNTRKTTLGSSCVSLALLGLEAGLAGDLSEGTDTADLITGPS